MRRLIGAMLVLGLMALIRAVLWSFVLDMTPYGLSELVTSLIRSRSITERPTWLSSVDTSPPRSAEASTSAAA